MAVQAALEILKATGRRRTDRHELKLKATGTQGTVGATDVLIHNISKSGLLLETEAQLSAGGKIIIDLPEMDGREATVIWADGTFFGCSFDRPLSPAVVSAAKLRSEPLDQAPSDIETAFTESTSRELGSFGSRLKRLRKERGLSIVQMSQRANVSRPTIWSWEAGKSLPRASKYKILSQVLEVTEDELRGVRDMPLQESAQKREHDEGRDLGSAIRQAKEGVAKAAGTSPDKVTLIIEI